MSLGIVGTTCLESLLLEECIYQLHVPALASLLKVLLWSCLAFCRMVRKASLVAARTVWEQEPHCFGPMSTICSAEERGSVPILHGHREQPAQTTNAGKRSFKLACHRAQIQGWCSEEYAIKPCPKWHPKMAAATAA